MRRSNQYKANEVVENLRETWLEQARVADQIREFCSAPVVSCLADPPNNDAIVKEFQRLRTDLANLQKRSDLLVAAGQFYAKNLPSQLTQAYQQKADAIRRALGAIQKHESHMRDLRHSLIEQLSQSNHSQKMLKAYGHQ